MSDEKDFDEDLGSSMDSEPQPVSFQPKSKTPSSKIPGGGGSGGSGEDISLFFTSTIGPGEKKQKLLVNTGNPISAIKTTVGSMFGLNPNDFHMTHGGVTLDENKILKNYNIRDGDTVLLIPASTAGK